MLCNAYLAWGTYKLNRIAWWVAVILTSFGALSSIITFSRMSLGEFFTRGNFSAQQLQQMQQSGMPNAADMVLIGVPAAIFLGYLLYTKRYFAISSFDRVE